MIVLAIDTATPQLSVAIDGPDGIVGTFSADAGRRHGETLAPAIALLRDATGVALSSIDRIAVDVGPGLFTGLRVGIATAAALAGAVGCVTAPVCSLDVLAHRYAAEDRPVAAVVDARRSEVFWALYLPGRGRVGEPVVASPEELAATLAGVGHEVLAVGDGAARYGAVLAGDHGRVEVRGAHPCATDLARLGSTMDEGSVVAPGALRPMYLRQADVRIGWAQRAPQTPAIVL